MTDPDVHIVQHAIPELNWRDADREWLSGIGVTLPPVTLTRHQKRRNRRRLAIAATAVTAVAVSAAAIVVGVVYVIIRVASAAIH
jgi:hypothetical protein